MISRCFIVLAVVGFSCAATWMGHLPMKPKELAHKEGCYVKEVNDVIPFGAEVKPIGSCVRINCEQSMVYYASCGVVISDQGNSCYVTDEDTSVPYPECCPRVKCEQDNRV